ncbi:MAG TPA: PIN domain-containing protein [Fimbriiglobus sp.]|jgi:tRNA(fMet)-specific endonuclease VapC
MTYVIDTDMLTLAFRSTHGVRERIDSARVADDVAISLATQLEVLRGRIESVLKAGDGVSLFRAQERWNQSVTFLKAFRVIPFTAEMLTTFDRLRVTKLPGKPDLADVQIASTTLAHGATLVARNTKDFAGIPGLKLENWAA